MPRLPCPRIRIAPGAERVGFGRRLFFGYSTQPAFPWWREGIIPDLDYPPYGLIFAVWLKCHLFVFELSLYSISRNQSRRGLTNATPHRLRHSHFDRAWPSWLFSPSTGRCSGAVAADPDQIIEGFVANGRPKRGADFPAASLLQVPRLG